MQIFEALHVGRVIPHEGEGFYIKKPLVSMVDFPEFIHLYTQSSLDVEFIRFACSFAGVLILDFDEFKIMWHFGASKTKMNIDMSAATEKPELRNVAWVCLSI